MRTEFLIGLTGLSMLAPAASSSAAQSNVFGAGDPYQACVMAIDTNPTDAFERALEWRSQGGGDASRSLRGAGPDRAR